MEGAAECVLVLIGATPEANKELVGFQTGVRESAQSWRELLIDIKQRGLEIAPDLAVGDGALGFWKAIEQVFPSTRHQRCWVHKTANVLNKVALSVQANMKTDLREIYGAPTRAAEGHIRACKRFAAFRGCRPLLLQTGRSVPFPHSPRSQTPPCASALPRERFRCVPGMYGSSEVQVLYPT